MGGAVRRQRGRVRARWVAAVLAAVAVAGATGCVPPYTGNTAGPKVGVLGDSITYWVSAELNTRLQPAYQVSITADGGATIADELPKADDYEASLPDVMVVELGANDAYRAVTAVTPPPTGPDLMATVEPSARALADLVGRLRTPRCVVLVNIGTQVLNAAQNVWSAELNARMAGMAAASGGRIRVADWDAALRAYNANPQLDAQGQPVRATYDTVHPDGPGKALFADTVGDAVDGCPSA